MYSVCLSVCLSGRITRKSHSRTSPISLCMLPVAVARSSDRVVICTSGFMDDVIFIPWDLCVYLDIKTANPQCRVNSALRVGCLDA